MQLSNLKSNPHGVKSLINLIDRAIGTRLYPPPGSEHYFILLLDNFHGPSHINCEKNNKSEIRTMKISNACNITTNTHTNQI